MPSPRVILFPLVLATAAALSGAEPRVDFARDIRPLLAAHCYDCHGPEKTKGGLSLTSRSLAARGGESGAPALVPGQSAKSELIARLTTASDDDVMPQKAARLKPAEIALLSRWIDEGAVWPDNLTHWAYVAPVRPPIPAITDPPSAIANPIDAFVLAKLHAAGVSPSPAADRARWLRRVSLDLIGLPPTLAELAAFEADTTPGAHERVVDRLLASPHYGEKWARPWLDLARYADSHGFQRDDLRESWPYRDWVVRAMNADLPFDQFTLMQIAGDLLPRDPKSQSLDPLIATGFHRAAPTNVEAGTDQEEGRVNQVIDRVNTTATVWLGTTLECAQCHNHKYDPFTQRDYYRLFAYFNSTERETAFATAKATATLAFTGPFVSLPDAANDAQRAAITTRLKKNDDDLAAATEKLRTGLPAWETAARAALAAAPQSHALDVSAFESSAASPHRILEDQSVLLFDDVPDRDTYTVTARTTLAGITAFKLEALTDPSLPGNGPGRGDSARPNFVLNAFTVTATTSAGPAPVRLVRATQSFAQNGFPAANLLDAKNPKGWAISPQFGRDHWAVFELAEPLDARAGTTLVFTLAQNFGSGRTIGRFRLSAITGQAGAPPVPAEVAAALRTPPAARTAAQADALLAHVVAHDATIATLRQARRRTEQELAKLTGPRTLVMREVGEPRMTSVLKRGNFLDPGEHVAPGVPATLHPLAPGGAGNRLDLARWLVSRDNPLVARVTVNRWWQEFFGEGLVRTPEDFGVKGEPPTHPELLDWLAVEFMEGGWSMKKIHRLIALSATYQQSSRLTPALRARDDRNRLLARGPRFRLEAEAIRDNALAIAGLLSPKIGGPPVRPYQPPGLWDSKVGGDRVTYEVSPGEDAYRRGLYTIWKRASPYPSFVNFDASSRGACTVRRSRSNTPLQALTLLNDPVYVEAAAALAARIVRERPDAGVPARVTHAFRLCLTREPTAAERVTLEELFAQQNATHRDEQVAWQAVASALLNLDETITKN
ncbi:MAG: PSD1 domain-containing protein [Verrucomicrobia bacterium]|nr:PSD1 domain-containing protein [Verrucomicrobiota bacterium]